MRDKKLALLGIVFTLLCFFVVAHSQPQVKDSQPQAKGGSCVSCHASMPLPNLSKPVSEWKTSIHDQKDVMCDGCHGGTSLEMDPMKAMDPNLGFVGKVPPSDMPSFCGRCHKTQLEAEAFKESTHFQMSWHGKEAASCPTCHGDGSAHAIVKASLDAIMPKTCLKCHKQDDERPRLIKEELASLKGNINAFEGRVRKLKAQGMPIGEQLALLETLRSYYLEAVHALGARNFERQKGVAINTSIAKLDQQLKDLEQQAKGRRMIGFGVLAFILVIFVVVHRLYKTLPKTKRVE